MMEQQSHGDARSQENSQLVGRLNTSPQAALKVLMELQEGYATRREECAATDNEFGSTFALKVVTICENLAEMVNESAFLSPRQRRVVVDMITAHASEMEIDPLNVPGEGYLKVLDLATYINSCTA